MKFVFVEGREARRGKKESKERFTWYDRMYKVHPENQLELVNDAAFTLRFYP